MSLEDEFCDIVKKARLGLGQSLAETTKQLNISSSDWEKLEKGICMPTVSEVETCSKALFLKFQALYAVAIEQWEPRPSPDWVGNVVVTVRGDIGGYEVKGYILFDPKSKEAVFIDTAYNPKAMLSELTVRGLKLVGMCLTHGHADHAGGLDQILQKYPVPVYLGGGDFPFLPWKPKQNFLVVPQDKQRIKVGSLTVICLATPGHTLGGFCYQVSLDNREICFVGDTIFAGSIGRSNPFSLYPLHLRSVRECILRLSSETVLFPGHGPATTVKEEIVYNSFGT